MPLSELPQGLRLLNELKLHGVKGLTRDTNGGHIEIAWQVVPEKEVRRVFVAKTASDWRARMNTRAEVRKLLRADNVVLKAQNEKPQKPKPLAKALELPQPDTVVPMPDQMKALRGELADLTELVLRLTRIATGMREVLTTHVPKPQPAPAGHFKFLRVWSVKFLHPRGRTRDC
ncbi:hypothetical protein ACVME8_003955 [Bradyrhizobium diazoefficiens]